jgi:hypothetical protein
MFLHIIIFKNDVKIYFTFISFIKIKNNNFDKILGIKWSECFYTPREKKWGKKLRIILGLF